eukprot:292063_1
MHGNECKLYTLINKLTRIIMGTVTNLISSVEEKMGHPYVRNILGDTITNILRAFLVILSGRFGIIVTWIEWWLILLCVAYFFSPIDIIPDSIPIIGLLDDMLFIYVLYLILKPFIRVVIAIIKHNDKNTENADDLPWVQNDDEECVVCYGENGPRNTIFIHCGHKLCKNDAQIIIKRKMSCPFCRATIESAQTNE